MTIPIENRFSCLILYDLFHWMRKSTTKKFSLGMIVAKNNIFYNLSA